jgi:hypothetical protein
VSETFTAGDWAVELDLYSGGSNPDPPTQAIGVAELRGGVITPHKDIRDALGEKTRRYGALDRPYLIAVADGKGQLFSKASIHSALAEAVFGDEIVQFKGGAHEITRAKNGFWHGPKGPRNRHVSGVLLLPETGLWKLREEKWQPVLAVNPWAERPLPDALRTMSRFEADNPGRQTVRGHHWAAGPVAPGGNGMNASSSSQTGRKACGHFIKIETERRAGRCRSGPLDDMA